MLSLSYNDNYIAFDGYDNIVVYSLESNSTIGTIDQFDGGFNTVTTIIFHPSQNILFVSNKEAHFQVFSIPDLKLIKSYPVSNNNHDSASQSSSQSTSDKNTALDLFTMYLGLMVPGTVYFIRRKNKFSKKER